MGPVRLVPGVILDLRITKALWFGRRKNKWLWRWEGILLFQAWDSPGCEAAYP